MIMVAAVGVFYLGKAIARGAGGDEQRIIESVLSALAEKHTTAKITTSQAGGVAPFNLNGEISLVDMDKLNVTAAFNAQALDGRPVKADVDIRGSFTGDMYAKMNGLGIVSTALLGQVPEAKLYADQAISKIQGKWLVMARDGKVSTSPFTCAAGLFKSVQSDEAAKRQLADLYKKHRFIFVKNVDKKAEETAYSVQLDERIFRDFLKDIQQSDAYKKQKDCQQAGGVTEQPEAAAPTQIDQAPESVTTTFTVANNGKLKSVAISSSAGSGGTATHITAVISHDKVVPRPIPSEDLVPYTEIASDLEQISGVFQRAAQSQAQLPQQ